MFLSRFSPLSFHSIQYKFLTCILSLFYFNTLLKLRKVSSLLPAVVINIQVFYDKHIRQYELSSKDITKEVVFDVIYSDHVKSPWGTDVYGFSCTTLLNRKKFNLTYNAALESGGVLIGENVQINVELELNPL